MKLRQIHTVFRIFYIVFQEKRDRKKNIFRHFTFYDIVCIYAFSRFKQVRYLIELNCYKKFSNENCFISFWEKYLTNNFLIFRMLTLNILILRRIRFYPPYREDKMCILLVCEEDINYSQRREVVYNQNIPLPTSRTFWNINQIKQMINNHIILLSI